MPTPSAQNRSVAKRRRQAVTTAIALVVIAVVVAITWVINNRAENTTPTSGSAAATAAKTSGAKTSGAKTGAAKTSAAKSGAAKSSAKRTPTAAQGGVPANAAATLALIDAGRWPPADAPGTNGGTDFRNNERRLPTKDAQGRRITYEEWDVNAKKPGRGRDAERIVTGSDGSAWYTGDHYQTFIVMRGPS